MSSTKKRSGVKVSSRLWWLAIIIVAIIIDVIDLFFGWIPILGTFMDVVATGIASVIFWPIGLIYGWEVLAFGPLNVFDGFVPTFTIITILSLALSYAGIKKRKGKRKKR
jgi:hypothetical protein